jgi:hypothetical protein
MRELPNKSYADTTEDERWEIYVCVRNALWKTTREMFGHGCSFSNPNCDVYAGLQDELLRPEIQRERRKGKKK